MRKRGRVAAWVAVLAALAAPLSAQGAFGTSVAAGEGEVFVGEPQNAMGPGAVYVFRPTGAEWIEAARMTAPDGAAGDGFGSAVAWSPERVLVGATPSGGTGAAHLFELYGRDWVHAARLEPGNGAVDDEFGAALDLAGDIAIVGAPASAGSGAAYLFRRHGPDDWGEVARLAPTDLTGSARFGAAVAIAGEQAFIGAPGAAGGAGRVYVYRRDGTGEWTQDGMLGVGQLQQNDAFGSAIASNGELTMVSTPALLGGMGGVFVFGRNAEGDWEAFDLLLPFDGDPRDAFGTSLAFDGEELWVGAPSAVGRLGAAYALRADEELGWSQAVKKGAIDPKQGDRFGTALDNRAELAVVGIPRADYGAGKAMVFQRDEAGGWSRGALVVNEIEGLAAVTGGEVECRQGSAELFECGDVDLVSFLPVQQLGGERGAQLNDIWGWTDPETGREYALVGRMDGTTFVDISDPANPVVVGNLPKPEHVPGSTWRDIKVYRDHAFIVADGAADHGMQVVDLTRLRGLAADNGAPATLDEDVHYDRIHSAHNIVIDEATGFAYAVGASSGGETCGGGLHMIDVRDPKAPTFAGCFADPQTGRASTGYTHDAQCVIYRGPDADYQGREICFGANETALSIADVTDKETPVAITRVSYPNVAYSHQGWLSEDQRYFFMNDELDELNTELPGTRTLVWDISELDDPQLVREFYGTTRATDHNLYIVGDLMYQSNYVSGLRILDISDPENPEEVAFFDTVPFGGNEPGFGGSWSNYPFFESGVIPVTSSEQGLFILRKRDPVF